MRGPRDDAVDRPTSAGISGIKHVRALAGDSRVDRGLLIPA